jgi:hypothetical protein
MISHAKAPARILVSAAVAFGAMVVAPAIPAEAGCPPEPPALCRELGKTKFAIDSYGNVSWQASHGPSTNLSDFGNPDESSHYFLCAWDGNGLVVAADIPPGAECPGGSCWSKSGSSDLSFRDLRGNNSDLRELDLSGSRENRTKIRAQTMVIGGINLPIHGDVLVQLSRSDSPICFESWVPAEAFTLNYKGAARAKVSAEQQGRKSNDR